METTVDQVCYFLVALFVEGALFDDGKQVSTIRNYWQGISFIHLGFKDGLVMDLICVLWFTEWSV